VAYSSSVAGPSDIFVKASSGIRPACVFHLALPLPYSSSLSRSRFGPFFYERWGQARISLLAGDSSRRLRLVILDGRFSSRKLMDTLTRAKKKTPLGSVESSRESYRRASISRAARSSYGIVIFPVPRFSLPLSLSRATFISLSLSLSPSLSFPVLVSYASETREVYVYI